MKKVSVNTNDITASELKFLNRFRQLSDLQKGRILERMDIFLEKDM